MKGVNKAILVGTVGKDPETKTFQNGGMLTQFSIATNESWTDKNTGEKKQTTEWHRVVTNGKLAEISQKYVKQGMKVYIEGSIKTRQWTDQNGQERYVTEIQCQNMQMLDSPNQGQTISSVKTIKVSKDFSQDSRTADIISSQTQMTCLTSQYNKAP